MPDQEQLDGFLEGVEPTGSRPIKLDLLGVMGGPGVFHKDTKLNPVASQIALRGSTCKARPSSRGIPRQAKVTSNHKHLVNGGLVIGYPTGSAH